MCMQYIYPPPLFWIRLRGVDGGNPVGQANWIFDVFLITILTLVWIVIIINRGNLFLLNAYLDVREAASPPSVRILGTDLWSWWLSYHASDDHGVGHGEPDSYLRWYTIDDMAMFLKSKLEFAGMVEGDLEGQFCEIYSCKNITHRIT